MGIKFHFQSENLDMTAGLGRLIGRAVSPGAVIGLQGPLGAGKTELVRGLAQGLGISADDISSPTFVLEVVYDIAPSAEHKELETFHHWDLYRITTGEIECEIFDNAGDARRITAVEWPERVPAVEDLLDVRILVDFLDSPAGAEPVPGADFTQDSGKRRITVEVMRGGVLAEALAAYGESQQGMSKR